MSTVNKNKIEVFTLLILLYLNPGRLMLALYRVSIPYVMVIMNSRSDFRSCNALSMRNINKSIECNKNSCILSKRRL